MTNMTLLHDVGPPLLRQSVVVEPIAETGARRSGFVVRHTIWYEGGAQEEKEIAFHSLSAALEYAHGICGSDSQDALPN